MLGSAVGQDGHAQDIALVLIGHQAAGHHLEQPDDGHHHQGEQRHGAQARILDEAHGAQVAVGHPPEGVVEPDKGARRRIIMGMRLEQQGAERRGERQGHNARKHHGHRDGDGELLVHLARQTAHERHGDEHRAEHQHDGDNRGRDLVHGLGRGLLGRQVLGTHDALDVFQHHDGVVHHDADGQHHAEERQGVDGVAQGVHAREGADDGHRHGDAGNQGGPPVLEEDVNHDEHQDHGFHQSADHLFDGFHNKVVGIHHDPVGQPVGQGFGDLLQAGGNPLARGYGIGAGQQIDRAHTRGHAVEAGTHAIVLAAQLDAGHILEAQHGAVLAGADDDLAELVGRDQTSFGINLPGELGGGR